MIALTRDGEAVFAAMFTDGEPAPAPPDVVAALEALDWDTGTAQCPTRAHGVPSGRQQGPGRW